MKRINSCTIALMVALAFPFAQSAWAAGAGSVTTNGNPTAGAAVFNGTCVACHGSDGKGIMPGMPDFTASNGVLSLPTPVLEKRITEGFSDGNAPMAMPAKGGNPSLSSDDIRNVIAYMRSNFKH